MISSVERVFFGSSLIIARACFICSLDRGSSDIIGISLCIFYEWDMVSLAECILDEDEGGWGASPTSSGGIG